MKCAACTTAVNAAIKEEDHDGFIIFSHASTLDDEIELDFNNVDDKRIRKLAKVINDTGFETTLRSCEVVGDMDPSTRQVDIKFGTLTIGSQGDFKRRVMDLGE